MPRSIHIRPALPENTDELTTIAFAAKRHWGYPESWIQTWADELTFSEEDLRSQLVFKAIDADSIVGVCALKIERQEAELTALWILPDAMGRGIGRALFGHVESIAKKHGSTRLLILSDPHAKGFYLRMGATVYDQQPADMEGTSRWLPKLQKRL